LFFSVVCKNYYIINIYKYIISYQMVLRQPATLGGRKRRTMRGGVEHVQLPSGGRKRRTMRGGVRVYPGLGGRKRRTMRGGIGFNPRYHPED
jgi:hypothetical protein